MTAPYQPFGVSGCPEPLPPTKRLTKVLFSTIFDKPSIIMLSHMYALQSAGVEVEILCGNEKLVGLLPPHWDRTFSVHRIDEKNAPNIVERLSEERFNASTTAFAPWRYVVFYPKLQFLLLQTMEREACFYVGGDMFSAVAAHVASRYHHARSAYLLQEVEISEAQAEEERLVLTRFQLDLLETIDTVFSCHHTLSSYFANQAAISFPNVISLQGTEQGTQGGIRSWSATAARIYERAYSGGLAGTATTVCFRALEQAVLLKDRERIESGFSLLEKLCSREGV